MVREAMFGENRVTAEQLALQAIQANAAQGAAVLANLQNDTAAAGEVAAVPAPVDVPESTAAEDLQKDLEAIKNVIKH